MLRNGIVRRYFGRRKDLLGALNEPARRRTTVGVVQTGLVGLNGPFHVARTVNLKASHQDGTVLQHHRVQPDAIGLAPGAQKLQTVVKARCHNEGKLLRRLVDVLWTTTSAKGHIDGIEAEGGRQCAGGRRHMLEEEDAGWYVRTVSCSRVLAPFSRRRQERAKV